MRAKKLSATILAVVMLCMTFMTVVSAEEPAGSEEINVTYGLTLNGGYYSGWELIKKGSTNTLGIQEVSYGGEMVEASDITYQWCSDLNGDNEIAGETASSYSFTYNGEEGYSCWVTVSLEDGSQKNVCAVIPLKEDSLIISGSCDLPCETEPEDQGHIQVSVPGVEMGTEGTLTVDASSTVNKDITYQWYHETVDSSSTGPEMIEGATGKTYTFKKTGIGSEIYRCEVSEKDRDMPKWVFFTIEAPNTLKMEPKINGVTVRLQADETGCLYGTQVGKVLNLTVNASSTSGAPLTYKWLRVTKEGPVDAGTSAALSVTKADAANSLYGGERGAEEYECWVEDGTARKGIRFCLYLIDTKNSTVETPKGALSAVISNGEEMTEDLDTFLDSSEDVKAALAEGKIVSGIKLGTKAKTETEVEAAEQTAIHQALSESGVVGMYLDVNLYAEVQESLRGGDVSDVRLTETGSPVKITLDVPEDMLNTDSTVNRTYQVIRVHEGKAEILGCAFGEENKTITFSTDKFSTYALTYADERKSQGNGQGNASEGQGTGSQPGQGQQPGTGSQSEQGKRPGQGQQSGTKAATAAVATGDSSSVGGYVIMMLLASGVFAGMFLKKRNA